MESHYAGAGRNRRGRKDRTGFTYADTATAKLIRGTLAGIVTGQNAFAIGDCWNAMVAGIRNLRRPGICSMAIAAVDNALWDLKARILDLPLVSLLGAVRTAVPVYESGGFTSYKVPELQEQLSGWTSKEGSIEPENGMLAPPCSAMS